MSFSSFAARSAAMAVVSLLPVFAIACAATARQSIADTDPTLGDASAGDGGTKTGSKGSDASTRKPATADSACADFAKARCEKDKSCNAFLFGALWGDLSTCEDRRAVGCADRFAAEGTTWKPDNLAACAASLEDVSCDDLNLGVLPSACEISPGTLEENTACAHDDQCETRYCKKGSVGGCGSCEKRAKAGSSCSQDLDCEAGLMCVSYSCRAPAQKGESCNSAKPCVFGLVCNGGSCKQGGAAGSPCGEEPGLPDPCDRANGVFCSALIMSCEQVAVVPAGGDCNAYSGEVCAGGGVCDGYECLPPLQEGESCQVTGNQQCQFPAVCDLGKCKVITAESCE